MLSVREIAVNVDARKAAYHGITARDLWVCATQVTVGQDQGHEAAAVKLAQSEHLGTLAQLLIAEDPAQRGDYRALNTRILQDRAALRDAAMTPEQRAERDAVAEYRIQESARILAARREADLRDIAHDRARRGYLTKQQQERIAS